MMLNNDKLSVLRCPMDRSPLSLADGDLIARVNAAIEAGSTMNQAGRPAHRRLDGGLIRAAGDILYPIVDGIPLLLADEAIRLERL